MPTLDKTQYTTIINEINVVIKESEFSQSHQGREQKQKFIAHAWQEFAKKGVIPQVIHLHPTTRLELNEKNVLCFTPFDLACPNETVEIEPCGDKTSKQTSFMNKQNFEELMQDIMQSPSTTYMCNELQLYSKLSCGLYDSLWFLDHDWRYNLLRIEYLRYQLIKHMQAKSRCIQNTLNIKQELANDVGMWPTIGGATHCYRISPKQIY